MNRSHFRLLGVECLYMILNTIIACISAALQFVGRKYQGSYSDIIFSGSVYSYNAFFYILGLGVFILYIFLSYRFFFSRSMKRVETINVPFGLLYFFAAIILSLAMLAALIFELFVLLGLTDYMKPAFFENLTCFGFPSAVLLYMSAAAAVNWKSKEQK
ncbi:MAG: hypothetical protein IJ874_00445 [Ruminococcus sp.]|nr:hypothetical protein [Ruminococcus sp.]